MEFQGEYINLLDPKGRANIPARLRDTLNRVYGEDLLVVTKNSDGGLTAYPVSLWEKLSDKIKTYPAGPFKTAITRVTISPALKCPFDKLGRILIPLALRSYAELDKEIVIVGLIDKIEIYNKSSYDQVTLNSKSFLQNNQQEMADLGF